MPRDRIFLSYRRDDSPGYVSRLEGELERVFGEGRVFRDATDIAGGSKWKNVIDANLRSSAVLLLIIGPRWEPIWLERNDDEVNYVALELLRAQELDVPVIPVTLDGTRLSRGLDLGSINFIYDYQFYDLCDKQGRWRSDVDRLVKLLETIPGMGPARVDSAASPPVVETDGGSLFKWLAALAIMLMVAAAWFLTSFESEEPAEPQDQTVTPVATAPTIEPSADAPAGDSQPDKAGQARWKDLGPVPDEPLADISGTWQWKDGTLYTFKRYENGTYGVESPDVGSGQARYITDMPGKLEIELFDVGRGEFAGFDTGRALGWFVYNGSSRQDFGALIRVD